MALKPGRQLTFRLLAVAVLLIGLAVPVSAETRLSLTEAINLTEEHSYSVQSARYDSAAAAISYEGARADRYPSLAFKAQTYFVNSLISLQTMDGLVEMGSKDNFQADIKLSMPIYTGGILSHRIEMNLENSYARQAVLEAEQMGAAYRCRQAYLNVLVSQSLKKAAISSLERLDIIRRDVNNLFENGLADSIDILETELALESGRQMSDRTQTDFINATTVLAKLTGLGENEEIVPTEKVSPPSKPAYSKPDSSITIERPELSRYNHVIGAAERAIGVENGAYLPSLNGFAGYSYGMPNRDWYYKTWDGYFIVGLTLNWQFNLGGKTSREVRAAQQRAVSARMAQKDLLDRMETNREITYNNLEYAYRAYTISLNEYKIAARRFELARLRQEAGQLSVNRLLEMEAELTATEQQHQATTIQYYLAENEYLYAIGSRKIFGGL
jgi:outer membrane protein TolC